MKLIIELSENDYKALKEDGVQNHLALADTVIANGIPYEEKPKSEWIIVKDNYPDKEGEYLVSLENGRIVVADDRSIIENHDYAPKMLAWQPLPEPYKKGEAE